MAIESHKAAGTDPTHGAPAAARRAETNVARKREAREWDEQHGKLIDLSSFERDILPLIQGIPLSRLEEATGLSLAWLRPPGRQASTGVRRECRTTGNVSGC
jgi:hypothetical protein